MGTSVSNSIPKHISSTFFFDSLLPSGSMCVGLPRDQPTGEKPTQKNPQKNPKPQTNHVYRSMYSTRTVLCSALSLSLSLLFRLIRDLFVSHPNRPVCGTE